MVKEHKRILVIGDIHGCNVALNTMLNEVQPTLDDLIITLGDYIDRGPDSFSVLETIIKLHEQKIIIPLRGNHELFLLNGVCCTPQQNYEMASFAVEWRNNGAMTTINSYCQANSHGLPIIPQHHYHFLKNNCLDYYELDDFICVHGGVLASEPIETTISSQHPKVLYWKRTNSQTEPRHCSGKIVVCGHDVQDNGVPSFGENAICLDTGAGCGGWLSCLDLLSGDCWQTNEQGQVKKLEYGLLPYKIPEIKE